MPDKYPTRAKSEWIKEDERLIKIVLKGLWGPMEKFDPSKGVPPMPGFGGFLNDEEVAGVISYVRPSFGNDLPLVTPAAGRQDPRRDPGPRGLLQGRIHHERATRARLGEVEEDGEAHEVRIRVSRSADRRVRVFQKFTTDATGGVAAKERRESKELLRIGWGEGGRRPDAVNR